MTSPGKVNFQDKRIVMGLFAQEKKSIVEAKKETLTSTSKEDSDNSLTRK